MKERLGWTSDSRTTSTYIHLSWRCGKQDPYVHEIKKEEIGKREPIRAEEIPEMRGNGVLDREVLLAS